MPVRVALEGISGDLSTLGQPNLEPAWKQEVNRRLAAHKSRKSGEATADHQDEPAKPGNSRAAEAAARVAQRYAKAPTYSQMQAEEARLAVRAAEIATQVALEAQKTAESALAELHAAAEQKMRGPAVVESITRVIPAEIAEPQPACESLDESAMYPAIDMSAAAIQDVPMAAPPVNVPGVMTHEVVDGKSFDLRWEPDLPVRAIPMPTPAALHEEFELAAEDWWTPAQVSATLRSEPIAIDAQQTHANLIEFPRELVATRKMRPRLAEQASTPERQLSIFEVDPGSVSTDAVSEVIEEPVVANWGAPEWSGIQLDAHPARTFVEPEADSSERGPYLAPLALRGLAIVVDGSLMMGAFFAVATWICSHMQQLPAPKTSEALAVVGLLITGLLYHAIFCLMGKSTPGMSYAGIALCTFDDEVPTRAQLRRRLGAMVLSMLPVGLGLVWSVFDDDHLSWHDRYSGTYLRKR